jgi:polyisoprenoid-binding protein YceI
MKTKFLSLMAVLALASPAFAAETYNFDPNHASVMFQIRHLMSKVTGKFNAFEGAVQVDRDDPAASSVAFTIKTESIDTANERRDNHLRSPDFFDVASHPTINFESTSVKSLGDDTYEVTGSFTMRGVTKEIVLPVEVLGEMKDHRGNQRIGFEILITINRKDYGVSYNRVLDQGGFLLGDEVKITINLEAIQAKAE